MILILFSIVMATALAKPVQLSNSASGAFSVEIRGEGKKAVLFVHDFNSDRRNFEYLSRKLASENLRTVNIELQGHGSRASTEPMPPLMHIDVRSAMEYLLADGVQEIQCVGEGFGGILCLQAITEHTPLYQVAIVSPVARQRHQSLFAALPAYSSHRPLFVIVSDLDEHGYRTVQRLKGERPLQLHEVSDNIRGVSILREHPEMEQELVKWVIQAPDLRGSLDALPDVWLQEKIEVSGEELPF